MIIDQSYFIGELNIAQLGQRSVQLRVSLFIDKREPEFLRNLLGYAFYKEVINEQDGIYSDSPAEKWADLLNGADYVDANGISQHWDGWANDSKISAIANYIYYWWMRDAASSTTVQGEKEDQVSGSINVGPALKQMRAWNEMVDMNCQLYDFLLNKKAEDGSLIYSGFTIDAIGSQGIELFKKINIYNL